MAIELIRGLHNLRPSHQGCVVAIGNFDGVHIGHQALIAKVKKMAAALQVPAMIMTFEPLPKEYFGRAGDVPRLTRWHEKLTILSSCGVDKVFIVYFNKQLANLSPEGFVEEILYRNLAVKYIIVGDDFRFGKARAGDFSFLKLAGKRYGFEVEDMPSIKVDGMRVSSTLVREALAKGDLELAKKYLGRAYTMQGRVVHGDKRGRSIGFPTANIHIQRSIPPLQGVYAVRMLGIGEGVANVGVRPTIGGTRSLLEVHLFDFDQEIYGQQVTIEFCKKLRDEQRYASLDLLKEQIRKDAESARNYFAKCDSN